MPIWRQNGGVIKQNGGVTKCPECPCGVECGDFGNYDNWGMHLTPRHTTCSVCVWKIIHAHLMNLEKGFLQRKPVLSI